MSSRARATTPRVQRGLRRFRGLDIRRTRVKPLRFSDIAEKPVKCAYISNKIHKKIKFSKRMYVYYLLTRPLKTHLYAHLCAPRSSETVGLTMLPWYFTMHQVPPSRMRAGCGLLRHRQAVAAPATRRALCVARCALARCALARCALARCSRGRAHRRASPARCPPCIWSGRRRSSPRPASHT